MKREQFGELVIDHRASPGLTAAALQRMGIRTKADLTEGTVFETKTKSCGHCGVVVVMNPDRVRARGHCRKCDKYTCDGCVAVGDCRPIMKLADNIIGTDKPLAPDHQLITRRY